MISDWKQTALWKRIENSAAAKTVEACMPDVEAVLRSAGTIALDFTLHDAEHSFRVAERMAEIVPANANLNESEYALLLLSAYLHDIGMSPPRDTVRAHVRFLELGDESQLGLADAEEFQRWLDTNWPGAQPPIASDDVTADGIKTIEQIFAYYCRSKHNDWSETWIRLNVIDARPPLYPNWVDDLITLCRSHHEGLGELRTARFDARLVGTPSHAINLRYLACILRLADVLEFDPERTPEVILRHRSIVPSSRKFWQKDHAISFNIQDSAGLFIFSARTPNAVIHRAVIETANQIDSELAVCKILDQEGKLRSGFIPDEDRKKYTWPWAGQLARDISEIDGRFVYIDGDFRPDRDRILSILSGISLYKNEIVAVRELLQNAIDAVKEQIAFQRIAADESDPCIGSKLAEIHRIRLEIQRDADATWLLCSDDGVGMTKAIIQNHLLVSGSPMAAESVALDRLAKKRGFSVGRTGQFGIGVLSYFMIADEVIITTRRSAEGGDADSCAWEFRSEGVNRFGELRRASRSMHGTDVRLRLKSSKFTPKSDDFFGQLTTYIKKSLSKTPCRVEIRDSEDASKYVVLEAGWTTDKDELLSEIVNDLQPYYYGANRNLLTSAEQRRRDDRQRHWEKVRAKALNSARMYGPIEIEIPSIEGIARIWLPYFALPGGNSLAFLDIDDDFNCFEIPEDKEVGFLKGRRILSWKGFSVSGNRQQKGCIIEVDATSGASISVDRFTLEIKSEIEHDIQAAVRDISLAFLAENVESAYGLLNLYVANSMSEGITAPVSRPYWIYRDGERAKWQEIRFPVADLLSPKYIANESSQGELRGSQISLLSGLQIEKYEYLQVAEIMGGGSLKITLDDKYNNVYPAITWNDIGEFVPLTGGAQGHEFPKEWKRLAAIVTPRGILWNEGHPLYNAGDFECDSDGIQESIMHALSDQNAARAFLKSKVGDPFRDWVALWDNYESLLNNVVKMAKLPGKSIYIWAFMGTHSENNTWRIANSGVTKQEQPYRNGGEISLPSKGALARPEEASWWIEGGNFRYLLAQL